MFMAFLCFALVVEALRYCWRALGEPWDGQCLAFCDLGNRVRTSPLRRPGNRGQCEDAQDRASRGQPASTRTTRLPLPRPSVPVVPPTSSTTSTTGSSAAMVPL